MRWLDGITDSMESEQIPGDCEGVNLSKLQEICWSLQTPAKE